MAVMISLNQQGADTLRILADKLPRALDNISQSAEKMISTFTSVEGTVGPHADCFSEMLQYIKQAERTAADALNELPPKMIKTAEKIEDYISSRPTVTPAPKN